LLRSTSTITPSEATAQNLLRLLQDVEESSSRLLNHYRSSILQPRTRFCTPAEWTLFSQPTAEPSSATKRPPPSSEPPGADSGTLDHSLRDIAGGLGKTELR